MNCVFGWRVATRHGTMTEREQTPAAQTPTAQTFGRAAGDKSRYHVSDLEPSSRVPHSARQNGMTSAAAAALVADAKPADTRLDAALTSRGLARSRNHAAQLITDGLVKVDGKPVVKSSARVRESQSVTVDGDTGYVSRAAGKLVAALTEFPEIAIEGALVLDVGASTGGFTQVALERGARHVIALDVGHDQLVPQIADDERVSVVEGFNARFVTADSLAKTSGVAEAPSVIVGDLSFISLTMVLPALSSVATSDADYVLLIKPQFEVGRTGIKEGVVKDPLKRADAVQSVLWAAFDLGLGTAGLIASPVIGSAGNQEYLVWFSAARGTNPTEWLEYVTRVTGA